MAKTTVSAVASGKHSLTPPIADKLAGNPAKSGVAAPPPTRQALGNGTKPAWKSRLPVPIKRTSGGGTASNGAASLGATAPGSGLSNLPVPPPRTTTGGASKLPIPTQKTPGGASKLPIPSLKTPKNATGTPRKSTGTIKPSVGSRQAPRTGVTSVTGDKISQKKSKAKSPTPTNTSRTANDTTRKLAAPPKPKLPPATLRKPPPSPAKVRGTAGAAAAAPKRQNRLQPPPNPAPVTVINHAITSVAPVSVPPTPVVLPRAPPRMFVPLPSTYHGVKVCEGESFKPLPTELQKEAEAVYLERRRHKFAPKPGRPWLRAKRIVAPGEYYKQKPPPGPSPLKQCLSEEEVVTRRMIIRVKGKVVAPHLGPKGRPKKWKDPYKCPLAIRLSFHRKLLVEKGWSPWWGYLRELTDGEQ